MSDGSEAGEGVDFLGIEIPEHMDMRSCPGYTNQELSSLPFPHPPAPRMFQGDSWYSEEVPGPREWLKSGPNSWLYVSIPDPKYNALPPNEDPPDGPGYPNMCASPLPSPSALESSS